MAGLFLALFFLTQWNSWTGPFDRDEGEYAYAAWLLRAGGMPYAQAFVQKPPVVIYVYALAQTISDAPVVPVRVLASLSVLLTIGLTAYTARKRAGPVAGVAVLFVLPVLMATPSILPFSANTEKFMILPLTGLLALHASAPGKLRAPAAAAAGAHASAAVLAKPICALVVLAVALHGAWRAHRRGEKLGALFKTLGWGSAGFAGTSLLLCAPIVAGGAGGDLWLAVVTFNRHYARLNGWDPGPFLVQMSSLLRDCWPLFGFLAAAVTRAAKTGAFELGLLVVAGASAYTDVNGHYYVMLMPIWALVVVGVLAAVVDGLSKHAPARRALLAACAIAATASALLWPLRQQVRTPPAELSRRTYPGNPFAESSPVAERLAALTRPSDPVFVAGSEPQILYYARRRSPTRFTIMYPLMLPTPFAARFQQEVVDVLRSDPPAAIVVSRSALSWASNPQSPEILLPFLERLLTERYALVGGWVRGGAGDGAWKEGLDPRETDSASLLVYKRI